MQDNLNLVVAFECSDIYGRTSLTFSVAETDASLKASVADAFWRILLKEPDELSEFKARFDHIGAGVSLVYGCENGEPYFVEPEED